MREILFKAKRLDNGKWMLGLLSRRCDRFYIEYDFDNETNAQYIRVDPETISQYIGIEDKYGNKIFENDIVKIQINNNTDNEEFICVVQYSHLAFDFRRINGHDDKGCVVFARMVMTPDNYEIIGNIFNNPDIEDKT